MYGESVWVTVYLGPDVADVPFFDKYVTSLYFMMASLVGAGFGDITAVNDVERGYMVCVFVVGTLAHATIFANIAAQIDGSGRHRYRTRLLCSRDFDSVGRFEPGLARHRTTWVGVVSV